MEYTSHQKKKLFTSVAVRSVCTCVDCSLVLDSKWVSKTILETQPSLMLTLGPTRCLRAFPFRTLGQFELRQQPTTHNSSFRTSVEALSLALMSFLAVDPSHLRLRTTTHPKRRILPPLPLHPPVAPQLDLLPPCLLAHLLPKRCAVPLFRNAQSNHWSDVLCLFVLSFMLVCTSRYHVGHDFSIACYIMCKCSYR